MLLPDVDGAGGRLFGIIGAEGVLPTVGTGNSGSGNGA